MTTPDTPLIDTPRMQLATVLEIAMYEGFTLRPSMLVVAFVCGITSPDRAIYEQAVKG